MVLEISSSLGTAKGLSLRHLILLYVEMLTVTSMAAGADVLLQVTGEPFTC